MSSKNPVFSHIVTGATVGRGPVMGPNGAPVADSHRGVDLAVATGTPVRPVTNGVVVYSDYRHDYGNVVVIRHDLNGKEVYSLYAHLSEASPLKKNEQVTPTTTLGLSGSTGRSTGPHVHFEIVERQPGQPGPVAEVRPGQTDLSGYFGYKLLNPKANPDGLLTWDQSRLDRSQLTPAERLAQMRLTEPELRSYGDQLASIETKGKTLEASYAATSKSGKFLGRYQMDPSTALVEAGYTDKTGKWTDHAKAQGVASKEDFLNNPAAQEDALRRLTDKNAEFLVRNNLDLHIGKTFGGESLTGAGLLLGAHNSRGSVKAYVESGGKAEPKDGNGLGISKYVLLGDEVQPSQGHSVSALPVPAGPTNTTRPTTDSIASVTPRNDITYNKEGGRTTGVTLSFYAKADSDDGLIKKGDFVSSAFDLDGRLTYYSVRHTEGGVTTVEERIPLAAKGDAVVTSSKWVGSTLTFKGQWDSAGNPVGHRYTIDGLTYTRSIGVDGKTQWLDPNGLNADERIQQSYDQETQRRFSAPPELDSNGLNADERLQQSYDQETQRLFSLHPKADESEISSFRALSVEELRALEAGLAQAAAAAPGTNYADAGNHIGNTVATDGSAGADPQVQAEQLTQAKAQAAQTTNAVGLMNSIIGLQHWDNMSDLQRTAAIASIYNVVDKVTGGEALPGNLGTATSALGLLNALDKGDLGSIAYAGLSLVESLTQTVNAAGQVTQAGWVTTNLPGGVDFLPGLSFALAVDSGDPMSIASSGLSLMSSLGYIGPWGMVAAVILSVVGGMFEDDAPDIPTREGLAHAEWDAAGNTLVITDQDIEGGGPTATAWMSSMVNGLQAQLANIHDAAGNSYALVPGLLPSIGFRYDPDGFNLANGTKGFVYQTWTDGIGQIQTRYYDGQGNRSDGTGETLTGDFMQHAARAIAPAWAVATTLAHYQQGQGIHLPGTAAGMPQQAADGIHQTLQAITLALPVEPALQNALIDIDGDEYLERTQWLANNQQVLAIDADGNNQISVNELLSLDGPDSLHSLGWLDANGDQMLTDRDPAFSALRRWVDANADANSTGETQTMAQAGIVAIDFGSNPPAVVHADGSRTVLTVQTLTADVLGVKYEAVDGGVLQLDEQASGPAVATLHAVNTREFDGQAGHIHGGAADTDGGEETVDAGEERLVTTSANTVTTQSEQTSATLAAGDARLRAGASGNALSGQGTTQTAGTAQVRNNGIVFVPAGAAGVGAQMREATEDMVRSADAASFAPLAALAAGAAAVQWHTVATAATSQAQDANVAPAFVPATQAESARLDLQTWESSRASAAAPISPAQESSQAVTPVTWDASPRQAGGGATPAAAELLAPLEWISPTIIPPVSAGALVAASVPAAHVDDNTNPVASDAIHGSVALQAQPDGSTRIVFTPEGNFHGIASFRYTVTDPSGASSTATARVVVAAVSVKRLADIMDATPEPAFRAGRSMPPALEGRVKFEHVGFQYAPNAPEVINDLNLDILPGEVIGITGISGAGKTTLMRLMQRLYNPVKGRIVLDGMDLSMADTSWLRRQIGVVGQDTALFNRSVRDNIALGNPATRIETVMDSARLAGAHDFIMQLPDGYDTVIGERGSKLSGGQRARIAIARALVTNPQILLLDEATASLDYDSERVIHDNMGLICEGRTVFIVAHRLSTLRICDRILVLDHGRLIETGNHRELMKIQGRYASLYQAHQVLEEKEKL